MSDKMRVLQIIHGFNMGGAETLVKDYLLYLNANGVECRALCFEEHKKSYIPLLRNAGISIVNIGELIPQCVKRMGIIGRPIWYAFAYTIFRREVNKWKPDVIHSHLEINRFVRFAVGGKPIKGSNERRTRLFHTVHSKPELLWFEKDVSARERQKQRIEFSATNALIQNQGMRLIALHDRMKVELDELFEVNNTVVVKNGIDFKRFDNAKSSASMRNMLGIPKNAFVIGHVGRFSKQKNHNKILSVFKEIRKSRRDAFMLLVGDGELKETIQDELQKNDLNGCSLILSNREDVPDLMAAMDVFLFPSLNEGLGIVLIEAQKMKLPCIISDTVPSSAIISNLVSVKKLEEEDSEWAKSVLKPYPSDIIYDHLEEWDMNNVIAHLLKLYRGEE